MTPEAKEEITKRIALQLQVALTAWHEIYPEDSDADACAKSLDIVEFEIEDLLTRPDPPAPADVRPADANGSTFGQTVPATVPEPPDQRAGDEERPEPLLSPPPPRKAPRKRAAVSFRQLLIEIGREHPGGLDISTIVEEAKARGWSHPNPRNFVSITASQLVRGGLLVRRDRGTYALSPAFMGKPEADEQEPET